MTILWSPTWIQAPEFSVFRPYSGVFVVGWQPGFIVQTGRHTILQEIPFGGYRFHIKFKEDFWNWQSRSWHLSTVLEDLYATAPGDPTPISAGAVAVQFRIAYPYRGCGMVFDMPSVDPTYYFLEFPPPPPDYWNQLLPQPFELPYIYHP